MKKVALTIEEIKKLKKPLRNVNTEHRERLSSQEKFAVWFTNKIGTVGFFFFLLFFNVAWICWNVMAPAEMVFDQGWSFLVLLFINNILQILFMPLIIVGQNLQGRHSEARAQADFEVNTKAEDEIETILIHSENQNEIITEILQKLEYK